MGRVKAHALRVALVALFALGTTAAVAAPAHAGQYIGNCGTFFTYNCTVEYTSPWPGSVRAIADHGMNEIVLQVKTSATGSYTTRSHIYPGSTGAWATPWVSIGKYSYYRACVRPISGGQLQCSSKGAIYLGD
jgi:hypothetical protein